MKRVYLIAFCVTWVCMAGDVMLLVLDQRDSRERLLLAMVAWIGGLLTKVLAEHFWVAYQAREKRGGAHRRGKGLVF